MKPAEQSTDFEIYGTIFDGSMPKQLRQMLEKDEKEYPMLWEIKQGKTKKCLIKDKNWKFPLNYFLDGRWVMIFPFIISAPCIELRLYCNNYSKILTGISRPNLYALSLLELRGNKISSIEQLQFIEMPFLKFLHLGINQISKVSALNKCAWNHLSYLNLSSNQISAYEIARLKIYERLQYQPIKEQKLQLDIWAPFEYFWVLPKLNFSVIYGFFQNNPQSELSECLKRKSIQLVETG